MNGDRDCSHEIKRCLLFGRTAVTNCVLNIRDTTLLTNLVYLAAAAAKLLQSCPTLCYPIGSLPPGSAIPGILQAGTLEWVAISFSKA